MRILKVKGKNTEVIEEQIKKKYGATAIILSSQQEKGKGFFGWLGGAKTVATVAVKDDQEEKEGSSIREMETNQESQNSNMNELSYDVLLSLKEQMGAMQESIKNLKVQDTSRVDKGEESSREQRVRKLLHEKLLDQGIDAEIIESLLMTIEGEEDVEAIVRGFYTQIETLLSRSIQSQELPQIVFFVGPTGVGKTTTIAKLTADYVLNKNKEVVLFTSDTYRIAAIDQLRTYADILGVNIEIIYEENDLKQYLNKWEKADHIFIDTAGRSHKNIEQLEDIKSLLDTVEHKEVLLVVNASTPYKDIQKIVDTYEGLTQEFRLIITKLDETDQAGNIMNIAYYAQKPILYLTHGQNVPEDISTFNVEDYTSDLLGRINYE